MSSHSQYHIFYGKDENFMVLACFPRESDYI